MDQPEGDVRPQLAAVAPALKDERTLGSVIWDAIDEWCDGQTSRREEFPPLLLRRLAEAGFVVRKAGD